ncbi:hypothetical protein [Pectinatus haikarae]|uniref:hypothetical protein n=1 Tax=Pectinatus haikarae TaxID=349096 RepID=UPI0018C7D103|nr:hypothetical protein [Pectinatus haikarae]
MTCFVSALLAILLIMFSYDIKNSSKLINIDSTLFSNSKNFRYIIKLAAININKWKYTVRQIDCGELAVNDLITHRAPLTKLKQLFDPVAIEKTPPVLVSTIQD